MKKLITISFLLFAFAMSTSVNAQDYKSAVGLRLGSPWALSYKFFQNERNAIELYGAFRSYVYSSYFGINAAYQIHNQLGSTSGLRWYYGVGAGVNFYSFDTGHDLTDGGSTTIVASGYLGLEYTFADAPVSISADWVPTFRITGGDGFGDRFGADYGALSVRYIINR